MFSKILNTVSILAISGVLLGSSLNSSSWAMDEEAPKTGIPVSRIIDSQEKLKDILKLEGQQPETCLQIKSPVKLDIQEFSDLIKLYPKLEELIMAGLQISDDKAQDIVVRFSGLPFLRKLDLSNNQIGPYGGGSLGIALAQTPLVELNLENNQLDGKAAMGIAHLISATRSLKILNLCNNKIDDQGIGFICFTLLNNKSLILLDIRDNNITVVGEGLSIEPALEALPNLWIRPYRNLFHEKDTTLENVLSALEAKVFSALDEGKD